MKFRWCFDVRFLEKKEVSDGVVLMKEVDLTEQKTKVFSQDAATDISRL